MVFRVHLWGFVSVISIREFYIFITDGNLRRLSASAWLGHLILAVEYMILYKFS